MSRRIDTPALAARTARQALGWTQADLAAASGVAQVTIARAEAGMCTPRPSTLAKLMAALAAGGATVVLDLPPGGYTLTATRRRP